MKKDGLSFFELLSGWLTMPFRKTKPAFLLLLALEMLLIILAWSVVPFRFSVGDAVAQFMPQSLQGYRAIKHGELPLFNFYQFQGMPLIELGYFPVLYPGTFFSFSFAEYILGNVQWGWDVLGFLQIFINALCGYLLAVYTLRISPRLAVVAGLSLSFLGINFLLGSEWFYMNSAVGFVLLCIFLLDRLVKKPKPSNSILLGLSFVVFWFATNINIFFYAMHFVAWFGILILFRKYRFGNIFKRKLWLLLLLAVVVAALGIFPSIAGIMDYSKGSMREIGKVSLDKYFWITNDLNLVLKYAWWPAPGKGGVFWHTPFSFYQGLITCVGLVLSVPYLLLCFYQIAQRRRLSLQVVRFPNFGLKKDVQTHALLSQINATEYDFATLFFLVAAVLVALDLSIGQNGILGLWLYRLPVYNWFRHSIKWAPFFQQWSVFCGMFVIDRCIKRFVPKQSRLAISLLCLGVTLALLVRFITVIDNPQRLTDVTLPLPQPQKALSKEYRHIGLWDHGDSYTSDIPARILGHDYATVWQLPTMAGYEPMIATKNLAIAFGNWHPGYYLDAETIDLIAMERWGLKYVRVPDFQSEAVLKTLQRRFPALDIVSIGRDSSLGADVLELQDARKIVNSDNQSANIEQINILNNSVLAKVRVINAPGQVTFAFTYNKYFDVYANSKKLIPEEDAYGRTFVRLDELGEYTLELVYRPPIVAYFKVNYLLLALMIAAALWLEFGRQRQARPRSTVHVFTKRGTIEAVIRILKEKYVAEIVRYVLVGGVAVLIDAVVYYVMIVYHIAAPSTAKRISFIAGSTWAFLANKYFTFRQPEVKFSEPLLFTILYICTFFINSFVHDILLIRLQSEGLAFLFATGASTCLNYIGQKWIVFREKTL